MTRRVEPELLDGLPADDPDASGSRRDLRRLNAWMGHVRLAAGELEIAFPGEGPRQFVELGAGDGSFLEAVAKQLWPLRREVRAVLVDQKPKVEPETTLAFEGLCWQVEVVKADVFDWLSTPITDSCDVMLANLFLHHFSEAQLSDLLRAAAGRTRWFIAIEPQRSAWALACSRLLGLMGCNRVTRHDAPVSVRAGFAGRELTQLWPANGGWRLEERRAGMFSHVFVARKG